MSYGHSLLQKNCQNEGIKITILHFDEKSELQNRNFSYLCNKLIFQKEEIVDSSLCHVGIIISELISY